MKPSSVAALRAVAEALLPPCDARAAAAGAGGDPASAALWAHTGGGDEVVFKVRTSLVADQCRALGSPTCIAGQPARLPLTEAARSMRQRVAVPHVALLPSCPSPACCQVIETIEQRLTPESRRELHMLLRLLGSRWGSLILLGRASVG